MISHIRTELPPMLRLAVPVILAELGWMGMGVVDTIMVGPLGPAAIAAVGVGSSIHFAVAIFGMGLLLGLDTLVSQAFGARQFDDCRRWLQHGIVLALLVAIPLMIVGFVVLAAIPRLGFHPDVRPLLRSFFSIVLWSTPVLLFYAAFRRYLQGIHIVTPVMFALVSANLVNAAANWTLIYGRWGFPALGVEGSAWATLVSRVYMTLVLLVAVWRVGRQPPFAAARRDDVSWTGAVSRAWLARLIRLGFPAGAQMTIEVSVFAAAAGLAGMLSPIAGASHQIALMIIAVAFMIPLGLSSAGAVRVGHAVGAADPRRAAAAGWTAILLGVVFMTAMALAFILMPRVLIGLFTTDAQVIALGSSLLLVAAVFQLFDGLQVVTTGVLRGLGDTRTPMLTNIAGHWLLGLPVGYSLAFVFGWGVIGLWIGLSIGLIIVGGILLWVWTIKIANHQRLGATLEP